MNYPHLLEQFLTHYKPALKQALAEQGELEAYIQAQAETMAETRARLRAQIQERDPSLGSLQLDLEADAAVRELYLTPG